MESIELRRQSKKAKIIQPSQGFRMPRPVRRLQRKWPVYALQGLSELSVQLRQLTGHDVIDLNRIMEFAQFIYKQQALAKRSPGYTVDEFAFDPQFTESFLPLFQAMYRDYWRI